jgi:NAD(P) transhydrogenase subunit beta
VGGIVGASGLLLTQIMCKAMNRDLGQILSGRRSQAAGAKLQDVLVANEASPEQGEGAIQPSLHEGDPVTGEGKNEEKETESPQPLSDPAEVLRSARSVIIVPGYGMAMAQAQNQVRQLTTQLEEKGAVVRYAIHPVAGRMPGHMNVLLAEVDVPYEQLFEMEAINDEFATTDLVVVIGANDVINPAAREAADTPIYGMPVLNVDRGREVFICNYDLNPGYAGVENPLYSRKQGMHLMLGDAKDSLTELLKMLG